MYPSGPDGVNASVLLSSSNSNDTDLQVSAFRLAASYEKKYNWQQCLHVSSELRIHHVEK